MTPKCGDRGRGGRFFTDVIYDRSLDGVGVSVGESGEVDADVGPGLFEARVDAVAGSLVDAI